jgi:hypothetical protein
MADSTGRDVYVGIVSVVVSGLISLFICWWSSSESSQQAAAALEASKENAAADATLTVQLNELEEWRRKPNLERLQSSTIDGHTLQTTLQNIGGRHAVLWSVEYHIAPKMGGEVGAKPKLTVDTGVQAKTCKLDLRNFDLNQQYEFAPPITIPPGEVLTLQITMPMETPSGVIFVNWNAQEVQFPGSPRSPLDAGYFTSDFNPFRR